MPRRTTVDEAVAAAVALAGTGLRFVGIDGLGGAGKSTLAARIADAAGAAVVALDDFSGPDVAEWDWARFGAEVLTPLLAGAPARWVPRAWTGQAGPPRVVAAGSLVVVEGVSATRAEAGVPWSLTVWVETAQTERCRRLRERDGTAMAGQWARWVASEEAYVAAQHPAERADLVVAG